MFVHLHWRRTIWHFSSDPERSLPSTTGWNYAKFKSNCPGGVTLALRIPEVLDLLSHPGRVNMEEVASVLQDPVQSRLKPAWIPADSKPCLLPSLLSFRRGPNCNGGPLTSGGGQLWVSGIWYFSFGKVYSDMRRFSAAFGHKRPMILHLWFLSWEEYIRYIIHPLILIVLMWISLAVLKDG